VGDWATVVGTLGGAAVGASGAWLLQRDERRHRDRRRWDQTKRESVIAVVASFDALHDKYLDWGAARHIQGPGSPQEDAAGDAANVALDQLMRAIAAVELIASDDLNEALTPIKRVAHRGAELALSSTPPGAGWDEQGKAWGAARSNLVAVARRELG
jgi:hypothetical protein